MKAFLIILVILVIAAGAVFYFGWVQIHLPAEHYAVTFTKTGGYEQQVIRPGEFSWRWERLIPTNMTVHIFDLHPRSLEIPFQIELPSAALYSSILPENPDFSIRGSVSVRFSILPESLPALVAEQKLTPDGLDRFYDAAADRLTSAILETLQRLDAEEALRPNLNTRMERNAATILPDLQLMSVNVDEVSFPDLEVYRLAQASYRDLVQTRDRSRNEAVARLAEEQVRAENARGDEQAAMETMRQYGELLNEYPILLKAMAVQRLSGEELLDLPELDLKSILE